MSADNQTKTTRRIDGFPLFNSPTQDKVILQFNNSLKGFKYVTVDELIGQPYELQASLGKIPGDRVIEMFGVTSILGTTEKLIWEAPEAQINYPPSAVPTEFISDDVNDTSVGTGARLILITGVDDNFVEQTEFIIPNGITPVTLVNQYRAINDFFVVQSGSTHNNVGNLKLFHGGLQTQLMGFIKTGMGLSNVAAFTVPAGHSLVITKVAATTEKDVRFDMTQRTVLQDGTHLNIVFPVFQSILVLPLDYVINPAPEKNRVEFVGSVDTGMNKRVTITMLAILTKNT